MEEAKKHDPYFSNRTEINTQIQGMQTYSLAKPEAKGKMTVIKPRLSNILTTQAQKFYLSENECMNRGFVLDSYPKTQEQCKMLFMEEVEETVDNEVKMVTKVNKKLIPETVSILDCKDDAIIDRINSFDTKTANELE